MSEDKSALDREWDALLERARVASNCKAAEELALSLGPHLAETPPKLRACRLAKALVASRAQRLAESKCFALAVGLTKWCFSKVSEADSDDESLNGFVLIGLDQGEGKLLRSKTARQESVLQTLLSVLESDAWTLRGVFHLIRDDFGLSQNIAMQLLPKLAKCPLNIVPDDELMAAYKLANTVSIQERFVKKCYGNRHRAKFLLDLVEKGDPVVLSHRARGQLVYRQFGGQLAEQALDSTFALNYYTFHGNSYLNTLEEELRKWAKDPLRRGEILALFLERTPVGDEFRKPESFLPVEHAHRLVQILTEKSLTGFRLSTAVPRATGGKVKSLLRDKSKEGELDIESYQHYLEIELTGTFRLILKKRCKPGFLETHIVTLLSESEPGQGLCIPFRPLLNCVLEFMIERLVSDDGDPSNMMNLVQKVFDAVSFDIFKAFVCGGRKDKDADDSAAPPALAMRTAVAVKSLFENWWSKVSESNRIHKAKSAKLLAAWFRMFQRFAVSFAQFLQEDAASKDKLRKWKKSWLDHGTLPYAKIMTQHCLSGHSYYDTDQRLDSSLGRAMLDEQFKLARLGLDNGFVTKIQTKTLLGPRVLEFILDPARAQWLQSPVNKTWAMNAAREFALVSAVPAVPVSFMDPLAPDFFGKLSFDLGRSFKTDLSLVKSIRSIDEELFLTELDELIIRTSSVLKAPKPEKGEKILSSVSPTDGTIRLSVTDNNSAFASLEEKISSVLITALEAFCEPVQDKALEVFNRAWSALAVDTSLSHMADDQRLMRMSERNSLFEKNFVVAKCAKRVHHLAWEEKVRPAFLQLCITCETGTNYANKFRARILELDQSLDAQVIEAIASEEERVSLENRLDPASATSIQYVDITDPEERTALEEDCNQKTWESRITKLTDLLTASTIYMQKLGNSKEVCATLEFIARRTRNESGLYRRELFRLFVTEKLVASIVKSTFDQAIKEHDTEAALANAQSASKSLVSIMRNNAGKKDVQARYAARMADDIINSMTLVHHHIDDCGTRLHQVWAETCITLAWIEVQPGGDEALRDFAFDGISRISRGLPCAGISRANMDLHVKPIFAAHFPWAFKEYESLVEAALEPQNAAAPKKLISRAEWVDIWTKSMVKTRSNHWWHLQNSQTQAPSPPKDGGSTDTQHIVSLPDPPSWLSPSLFRFFPETGEIEGLERFEQLKKLAGYAWFQVPSLESFAKTIFGELDRMIEQPQDLKSDRLFEDAVRLFYGLSDHSPELLPRPMFPFNPLLAEAGKKLFRLSMSAGVPHTVSLRAPELYNTYQHILEMEMKMDLTSVAEHAPNEFAYLLYAGSEFVDTSRLTYSRQERQRLRRALASITLQMSPSAIFLDLVKMHVLLDDHETLEAVIAQQKAEAASLLTTAKEPTTQEDFLLSSYFWGPFHPLFQKYTTGRLFVRGSASLAVKTLAPIPSIATGDLKRLPRRILALLFEYHLQAMADGDMGRDYKLDMLKHALLNPIVSENQFLALLSKHGQDEAMRDTVFNALLSLEDSIFWRVLGHLLENAFGSSANRASTASSEEQDGKGDALTRDTRKTNTRVVFLLLSNLQKRVPQSKMLGIYQLILDNSVEAGTRLPVGNESFLVRALFDMTNDTKIRCNVLLRHWARHESLDPSVNYEFVKKAIGVLEDTDGYATRPHLVSASWTVVCEVAGKRDLDIDTSHLLLRAFRARLPFDIIHNFDVAPDCATPVKKLRTPEEYHAISFLEGSHELSKEPLESDEDFAKFRAPWADVLSTLAKEHEAVHVRFLAKMLLIPFSYPALISGLPTTSDIETFESLLQTVEEAENVSEPVWTHVWSIAILSSFAVNLVLRQLSTVYETLCISQKRKRTTIETRFSFQEHAFTQVKISQPLIDFLRSRLENLLATRPDKFCQLEKITHFDTMGGICDQIFRQNTSWQYSWSTRLFPDVSGTKLSLHTFEQRLNPLSKYLRDIQLKELDRLTEGNQNNKGPLSEQDIEVILLEMKKTGKHPSRVSENPQKLRSTR